MRNSVVKRLLAKAQLSGEPDLVRLEIGKQESWSWKYPDVPPPDTKLSLAFLAAAWACHDIYGEDMPLIAANLMEAGFDSPSLRRLAGETNVTCSADVADLVAKAFREFNIPCPLPETKSTLILSRQVAREVIAGERDPKRGAMYLECLWRGRGWTTGNEDITAILALNDEFEWGSQFQRPDDGIRDDLLDAFANLAKLSDQEVLG
jgi:hypothetical protein